ncbi:hypothetical protein PR202_ga22705 [Eleusine coracana subsp. coracana]|uniref:Uncharacterized protein n=1 Tax=Eleusine coracana subsp. coracana TaxID=191504 RepID=A0AAV5D3Y7_ELECO|nr:hypothetical protein PR202_ga22705 [Eleusine coracana subsp. coracana]
MKTASPSPLFSSNTSPSAGTLLFHRRRRRPLASPRLSPHQFWESSDWSASETRLPLPAPTWVGVKMTVWEPDSDPVNLEEGAAGKEKAAAATTRASAVDPDRPFMSGAYSLSLLP